jgi:hypothetical protein
MIRLNILAAMLLASLPAFAQGNDEPKVETVVRGLANPWSLAFPMAARW